MSDKEIIEDIAQNALNEDYDYPSAKYGAEEMAKHKNEQFNKVCFGFRAVLCFLGVSSEKSSELIEAMYKDFIN